MQQVQLKKNEERRLKAGHLWVFSNEIAVQETPLNQFAPGEVVEVVSQGGKVLGSGYINPQSLIAFRLCSRDRKNPFSASMIVHRLKVALAMRERLFENDCYRLIHGEGDFLPGLVVDRYGPHLVVQITTAGMELMKEAIIDALVKVIKPASIFLSNTSKVRELEGLPLYSEAVYGDVPEVAQVKEAGLVFSAPIQSGQKTGWFYDQRDNRALLRKFSRNARVLDVYSYIGGWGINAAAAGASEVVCIDASQQACDFVLENARQNGLSNVEALQGNAITLLKSLREQGERFDVIVLDPPAFIKRRKDMKNGLQGYRTINQLAIRLLARDGILVSCSCSHHLSRDSLLKVMNESSRHLDRSMQILAQGYQSADHPTLPAIPETDYLKSIFSRVLPS